MTEKQTLVFSEKSVYGNVLFYPMNAAALTITEIAKRKTLSLDELKKLSKAFNIETDTHSIFKTEGK